MLRKEEEGKREEGGKGGKGKEYKRQKGEELDGREKLIQKEGGEGEQE